MSHISEISRSLSIDLYLIPGSIAICGKFYSYCFYLLRILSGLQIVHIIVQIMHFILKVSRYTKIAYIGVYLALICIERLFSTV